MGLPALTGGGGNADVWYGEKVGCVHLWVGITCTYRRRWECRRVVWRQCWYQYLPWRKHCLYSQGWEWIVVCRRWHTWSPRGWTFNKEVDGEGNNCELPCICLILMLGKRLISSALMIKLSNLSSSSLICVRAPSLEIPPRKCLWEDLCPPCHLTINGDLPSLSSFSILSSTVVNLPQSQSIDLSSGAVSCSLCLFPQAKS